MKVIIITIFSITLLSSIVSSQKACNGYPELCGKLYSGIAYPTTHNAYAYGKSVAANQNYDIPTQLKDGIRGFMLDANFPTNNTNEVHLCHSSCDLLDQGPAATTLKQIGTWLDDNPNEVITILWENAGKVPAAMFNSIYTQSGFVKYAHFQEVGKDWPTLNDMIGSGKRVVNFVDTGADPSVQWLMPEYSYVFETPFENENANAFTCTVDRPKNQERPMYVLNHFLYGTLAISTSIDVPQPDKANTTNSASLADHAKKCQQTFDKIPNFIAVDFYDQGSDNQNVLSITADLNGVQYVPKQLGDGKSVPKGGKGTSTVTSVAKPNSDLRNANILTGLAGVGTIAMFVL
ncbi:unnamed protein product [Rhizophagus irregularis]|uniref:PLC-like phosphodiesterase n=1 Tax=Rhizophagus irregularis TaxID=588596 RepID=A0A2N1NV21_9GLOM|nr:PLC-like phosphodiesterase [Rhizophagus irregularis]CAB4401709.1 unnamed protein product [Rhizophagus irregularis]CAB5359592.1 unnamed protein product [Rhizophagus irregularis]